MAPRRQDGFWPKANNSFDVLKATVRAGTFANVTGLNFPGGTVLVNVYPQNLAPGVYNATLFITGGPQAGSQSLPVTVTVTAFPPPSPVFPNPAPPALRWRLK